ncbi:uncharacterized protein LOC123621173 [Lemur catta]|uniref:uncharacterized protein LOC123621173 n=1 Tax=Lemur catta TaxID=9447 RepID=UPI001E2683F2|nr:uncharacterized protein LOC123621173 [Lemur catta]
MDSSLLAVVVATGSPRAISLPKPLGKKAVYGWCLILMEVSSLVFIMAILLLLLLLHQRDPQCCQVLCACHFFRSPSQHVSTPTHQPLAHAPPPQSEPKGTCALAKEKQLFVQYGRGLRNLSSDELHGIQPGFQGSSVLKGCPPQHLSTMGCSTVVQPVTRSGESLGMQGHPQGDEIFPVGLLRSHQLPLWQPARLPSYESVRKKDRQQQIHQLIAQRFGLWACREVKFQPSQPWVPWLPPSYEEALRSLPTASPNLGSAHPSQEAATCPAQGNTTV